MILKLDHLIFGNGFGLKSPFFDNVFYLLSGDLYTFSYGLGAQLTSIQWTHPKPGERRTLAEREFVVAYSSRSWLRVRVEWTMVGMPNDLDGMHSKIQELQDYLRKI